MVYLVILVGKLDLVLFDIIPPVDFVRVLGSYRVNIPLTNGQIPREGPSGTFAYTRALRPSTFYFGALL